MSTPDADVRVTLLGTGTSTGVPVIGCGCRVCTSDDPRDQRQRTAAYVEVDGLHLVIDTGPDFRRQALAAPIPRVDAVLYTHHHFDHISGLDDLRPYFFGNPTPITCFAPADTAAILRKVYGYVFEDGSYPGVPKLDLREVNAPFWTYSRYGTGTAALVTPIPVLHGRLRMTGYRIGRFAYLTDVSALPDASLPLLRGLDVLVLDALRHRPHPTHLTVAEAVALAQRIGARQTYFTHMTHDLLHAEEEAKLPPGIRFGYDGLRFTAAR